MPIKVFRPGSGVTRGHEWRRVETEADGELLGQVPAWLLWVWRRPDGVYQAEMTTSRPTVLWGMIAEHAAAVGRRVSIDDVCAVAVSSAQASGAWVVAASSRGPDFVMCVTDQVSEQLAELQQMLGEGPCHDVLAAAAPVLAADLRDTESGRRWPAFAPEARRTGAVKRRSSDAPGVFASIIRALAGARRQPRKQQIFDLLPQRFG